MRKLYQYIIIIFIFLLPAHNIFAEGENYVFRHLTLADGLSQSTILSIIQDKKGYMWFGTGDGLNRFDGYSFRLYPHNPKDSNSISDNFISVVFEDMDGHLWIGTIEGVLNRFERATEKFHRIKIPRDNLSALPIIEDFYSYPIFISRNNSNTITSIAEDRQGNIWFGTWSEGLLKYNKKTGEFKRYLYDAEDKGSLSFNRIKHIYFDSSDAIWVSTFGGGLNYCKREDRYKFDEEMTFVRFKNSLNNEFSLSDDRITNVIEDRYKNIWVATFGGGLNCLHNEERKNISTAAKFTHYRADEKNSVNNDIIISMVESENSLWIATFGGGLNKFNYSTKNFSSYTNDPLDENSIIDDNLLSLCRDQSGIIWIGTLLGKGISRLQRDLVKFKKISHQPANKNSLNDNVVWALHKDEEDILWAGTYHGGLNRVDLSKNEFRVFKNVPGDDFSISDNHIRAIKEDQQGNLWIGTYSGGLNMFDKKTEKFFRHQYEILDLHSLSGNQVQTIHIDSDSTIWVGVFGGGLNKVIVDDKRDLINIKFKVFMNDPEDSTSISDNRVYTIFEDHDKVLWIGSYGGGLNRFNKKTGEFFAYKNDPDDPNSISDNKVIAINEDQNHNLWIGTYGGGLNRFNRDKGNFTRFMDIGGVETDVAYGILTDKNNNLWMSSDNGIIKFNPKEYNSSQYDLRDGVQSMEFSGGAFFKSKDGEMFFGGVNGINYFYPDSIKDNGYIPPIVISSFKIFNQLVPGEKKEVTLSNEENFFSFEFAALDFTNPEGNHYAYKLEGLDKDWNYVSSERRTANYTNLAAGEYNFRVIGSNDDGAWNTKGASINIKILPPFYKTWQFILISLLLTAALIGFVVTQRVKNLLAIERLKSKLAADLHDNVGSGLTEISILSELIAKDITFSNKEASNRSSMISEKARELIDNMSDIVWMVNPKRDSLHDLIVRLKDSYSDFLLYAGISFRTNNLEKLNNVKLPMEYRQNLYLIFKEGINNSIKHSGCSKIILNAYVQGNEIEMKLIDNGDGFIIDNKYLGNGLENMKRRARIIGGSLKFGSEPDTGTVVVFSGKIGKINYLAGKVKKISGTSQRFKS